MLVNSNFQSVAMQLFKKIKVRMKVRLRNEILNQKSRMILRGWKKDDVSLVFLVTAFSCKIMTECVPLH